MYIIPKEKQSRYPDDIPVPSQSYDRWKANAINSLFESYGQKGEDGRGAAPSDIRPETVRHGETARN